ncbi:transposase [Rhodovulum sulfidophilum]|nr:transposase [Rhodovulum sulfidophilum]
MGIFRQVANTSAPWCDLPEEFGKWSSVYRQFRRWTVVGLWEQVMDTLNENGTTPDALQMVDSTMVRAHHQVAGAKRGLRRWVLAVQEVGPDQDTPQRQRSRLARENRKRAGPEIRLSKSRSRDGQ